MHEFGHVQPSDASRYPSASPVLLAVGRVNFDLYVQQAGIPISAATDYVASVGGSPANIAIVASRLGVPSAILSATGTDPSGDFVRQELRRHGVDTGWLNRLDDGGTSLALLSTIAPDRGERQFYRENPADVHVSSDVVETLPWESLRAVAISADALATGAMAETATAVARAAGDRGLEVWWDLDLRPSSWLRNRSYYEAVPGSIAPSAVVIGTEEEFAALLGVDEVPPDGFGRAIQQLGFSVVVLKRGPRGASVFLDGEEVLDRPARATRVVSTVGAGDTTAGALIAGRLAGCTWGMALDLAMDAAAWTVSRPYCSTGFPTAADLRRGRLMGALEVDPG